jgi:hypothetical protein
LVTSARRKYEALLRRADVHKAPGSELASHRVCYSTRDWPIVRCLSGQDIAENEGRAYEGKLKRATCVDAADLEAETPAGIAGKSIAFSCDDKPAKSKVYQRSGTHKGMWGLLTGRVVCEVLVGYAVPHVDAGPKRGRPAGS